MAGKSTCIWEASCPTNVLLRYATVGDNTGENVENKNRKRENHEKNQLCFRPCNLDQTGYSSGTGYLYLPLRFNPTGGHQTGSGKPSVEGGI